MRAIVDLQAVDPAAIWFSSSDAGMRRDFIAASLAAGRPLETLRSFLPTAGEKRSGVATFTVAAAPPGHGERHPASAEAPPRSAAITPHATARFVAVFLAYVDETLRLRAEPPPTLPAAPAPVAPEQPAAR